MKLNITERERIALLSRVSHAIASRSAHHKSREDQGRQISQYDKDRLEMWINLREKLGGRIIL